MDIKLGDLIIHRTLTEVQDNQFLYVETLYIVLAFDETHKQITAIPSPDWICGYQRDLSFDYDNLLGDGFSIDVLDNTDVKRSSIFKKLDSSSFETIGHKYVWFDGHEEVSVCVPRMRVSFVHKLRGYSISTFDDDFSAAMAVYPKGDENYIFSDTYTNIIIAPFNVEDNVHTLGNKIPKK